MHRLALANGIAPRAFATEMGHRGGMWSPRLEAQLPTHVIALLGKQTRASHEAISTMTFTDDALAPLLLPLRANARRSISTWMQYCPHCLRDDESPYFRRQWRMASRISCFVHRRGLQDRCPACRSGIASFDQAELFPQHFCARCGFDLRKAANPAVKAEARRLEYAIADILRTEAAKGATAVADLIGRVLRAPNVAGIPSAKALVSLSVSTRIRCYEHLAPRSYDWLIPENDARVAYRRCMILAAGGQKEWINRFADFLERRDGRPLRKSPSLTNVKQSELFDAYVRVMTAGAKHK